MVLTTDISTLSYEIFAQCLSDANNKHSTKNNLTHKKLQRNAIIHKKSFNRSSSKLTYSSKLQILKMPPNKIIALMPEAEELLQNINSDQESNRKRFASESEKELKDVSIKIVA